MPVKPSSKKKIPGQTKKRKTSCRERPQKQRQQRKQRKENVKRNTKKRKVSMQCTRRKATKFLGHAQLANDVVQDTLWETTTTGTLAVTVALHATNRNKQF
jgi:hypothetical protein